jgi:hypothetical protein
MFYLIKEVCNAYLNMKECNNVDLLAIATVQASACGLFSYFWVCCVIVLWN